MAGMTYYRIQSAARNPQELLDSDNWFSGRWGGEILRDCQGCADCVDDEWDIREEHWSCDGTGQVDDIRYGVSVCRSLEDLAAYYATVGGDLTDAVVVELDGGLSDDEGHDANLGEVLVLPDRIVSVTPVPEWFYDAALAV